MSAGGRPPIDPLREPSPKGSTSQLPPLFRQRNFLALWWGQLVSLLGERFTYLALVGLLAEHTHDFRDPGSSLLLSALANVMLAPVLLLAPFAGAWVDRWNLRRVVVLSDLGRAALVLLIPLLYALTHQVAVVFVLLFVLFTFGVFFLPAKSSLTPEIVPGPQLLAANSWLSAAGIGATGVGALAGGWIVDHWGWSRALLLNAVTYLVSVVSLLAIRYQAHPRPSQAAPTLAGYLRQVREGWHVVRASARVGLALITLGAVWLAGGFLHVAGNLHIQRAAQAPGMERLGVLLAVLGVGGGAGAWWLNTQGRRAPRPWLMASALILAGIGLLVFALSTRFATFAIGAFMVGVAAAPALMVTETLLQEATTPGVRGRVFGTRDFLMRTVLLVGVTAAGAITRAVGAQPALITSAALVAVAGVVVLIRARRLPESQAAAATAAGPPEPR